MLAKGNKKLSWLYEKKKKGKKTTIHFKGWKELGIGGHASPTTIEHVRGFQ